MHLQFTFQAASKNKENQPLNHFQVLDATLFERETRQRCYLKTHVSVTFKRNINQLLGLMSCSNITLVFCSNYH